MEFEPLSTPLMKTPRSPEAASYQQRPVFGGDYCQRFRYPRLRAATRGHRASRGHLEESK